MVNKTVKKPLQITVHIDRLFFLKELNNDFNNNNNSNNNLKMNKNNNKTNNNKMKLIIPQKKLSLFKQLLKQIARRPLHLQKSNK